MDMCLDGVPIEMGTQSIVQRRSVESYRERTPLFGNIDYYGLGGHVISADIVDRHRNVLDGNNIIFLYDIIHDDLVPT